MRQAVLLLAVAVLALVSSVHGQRPGRFKKCKAVKVRRIKKGKQWTYAPASTMLMSGQCAKVLMPRYYKALADIIPLTVSTGDDTCSKDYLALYGDHTNKGKEIAVACKRGEKVSVSSDPNDVLFGRVVSAYAWSTDWRKDKYRVTFHPVKCEDAGCEQPPTMKPTMKPTFKPTKTPTESPTKKPTESPTASPTDAPTHSPTQKPTKSPTKRPTKRPTESPTARPTNAPSRAPTGRPTLPCVEKLVKFSQASTINVADLTDVVNPCVKFAIDPKDSGYERTDAFIEVVVDVNFADPTEDCSRESISVYDGADTGSVMGGAFCSGKGISFHTTQDSTAIRLDKADDSFGPGYTATLIAKEATERVEGTACDNENCIRQALEGSVEGNSVGGGGKRGKKRERYNPKNRNKNITLIEIDSDFLLLNAPIVIDPLTTVHIQPKAPRTSVVLDGGKKIPIVVAGKNSHVQFRNIHFSRGFRQGKGGALVSGGTVDIKDCSFIDNTSEEGGGAIGLAQGAGESVITRSYFSGNHAKKGSGGAIYVEGHRLAIQTENIFADNQCSETGSVLFASKAELSVSGGTYENNRGEHVYAAKGTVFNVAN